MGPVRNPGCYSINAAKDLTAKKLIALTGMDLPDVTGIWVVLTRRGENDKQEITRYSLAAIFSGETPDPRLKPGDILWLRKSTDLSKLEDQRDRLTNELNASASLYGVNEAHVKDLRASIAAIDNQIETGGTQATPQDPAALDQKIQAGLEFQVNNLRQRFGENDPHTQSARLRLDSFNKEIAARDRSGSVEVQLSRLNDLRQALTRERDDARKAYGETNPIVGNLQSRIEEVEKEITSLNQKKAPEIAPSGHPAGATTQSSTSQPSDAAEVYIMGTILKRPGVYTVTNRNLTIKQLIAAAGPDFDDLSDVVVLLIRRIAAEQGRKKVLLTRRSNEWF